MSEGDIILTKDQRRAILHVRRGKDVFITGGSGTGKSFLMKTIISELQAQARSVLMCAPTGIAALHIGGVTIHNAFGFPAEPCITDGGHGRIPAIRTRVSKVVRTADVIIIDEISMVRLDLFDAVIASIEKAEAETGKHIQLIVCGDFCQLPPIVKKEDRIILETFYRHTIGNGYAFQGRYWKKRKFYPIVLTETVRQADPELIENLNRLRSGDTGCLPYFNVFVGDPREDAVNLYGYTKSTELENAVHLASLPGEEYVYKTAVTYEEGYSAASLGDAADAIPPNLHIKEGMRVLITANDPYSYYSEDITWFVSEMPQWKAEKNDSINGVTATVLVAEEDAITVKTEHGHTIIKKPIKVPVFNYIEKDGALTRIRIAEYRQFPLKPAHAITIHRSQGQTYEAANIDPRSFSPGQVYVALSRIRSKEGIRLLHRIRECDVITDPAVIEFYENLGKTGSRTGRPAKNADGTKRNKLIWVPKTLEAHIREDCDRGVPKDLKVMPRYIEGRVHMRVPEELYQHIDDEIKNWKKKLRETKTRRKDKSHESVN